MMSDFYGRRVAGKKFSNEVHQEPALKAVGRFFICQRCGSKHVQKDYLLPTKNYYCPTCILLGRITSDLNFGWLPEPNLFPDAKKTARLVWEGELTPLQAKIAESLVKSWEAGADYLIWAVTGAGKTEMLYPLLTKALSQKARICLASPRVDVCHELALRLRSVFPNLKINLQTGQSQEKYCYSPLLICTTHQLLHFKYAFDILIIDEIDAFPFANNRFLAYGVHHAKKKTGIFVYLTATPSVKLKLQARLGRINFDVANRRFHGAPLPVPKIIYGTELAKTTKIKQLLTKWQQRQQRFLIFVPNIALTATILKQMQELWPHWQGASVHASDLKRGEKITAFRKEKLDYLVTTTILERGVTFPGIQVLVLQADHSQFNVASLIQIAGRVGRSVNHATGDVYFAVTDLTFAVKKSLKLIKQLNARTS